MYDAKLMESSNYRWHEMQELLRFPVEGKL